MYMFILKICVMTQSRVSLGNRIDIMYNNSEVNIYKNLIYEMIHMWLMLLKIFRKLTTMKN